MKLQAPPLRYGIVLRPMVDADLERVRRWRNAPHVQRRMAYQETISPAMQQAWWAGLDPFTNLYFVIVHGGVELGVVHAKDIDWEQGVAETGIFVGKRDYLGTTVPVAAVLALMDHLFLDLGLKYLRARLRADAPQVLDFNLRLGYVVVAETGGLQFMEVDAVRYEAHASSLRRLFGPHG